MPIANKSAQFNRGVGEALITLMRIPVLPDDRKRLAVTIASASLGVGTATAASFIDELLDQMHDHSCTTVEEFSDVMWEPAQDILDQLLVEAA